MEPEDGKECDSADSTPTLATGEPGPTLRRQWCMSTIAQPVPVPTPMLDAADASAGEYRLRFFNFNMANATSFPNVEDLQGPGGRGKFDDTFTEPFVDGGAVDLAFSTLVETRLPVSDWLREYLALKRTPLDKAISQNACKEGTRSSDAQVVFGWMESLAANYNGNLKSILAFSSKKFALDESSRLFGRLIETTVAGLAIPNPKKAFMGRTVTEHTQGIRFIFTGAHFPISEIAAALESDTPLQGAKVALAKTLKRILHKANKRKLIDAKTVLFVQGDFNSRTVLKKNQAWDVLLELLHDQTMQAAMQEGLSVPRGQWYEIVGQDQVQNLPITYKFHEAVGRAFKKPHEDGNGNHLSPSFTIGDILEAVPIDRGKCEGAGVYRKTLFGINGNQLRSWGVCFKETDFRPFRFPACADRVAYWAPDGIAAHMFWSLPKGGYEVNHFQGGSDHRPVSLDAILRITSLDRGAPPEDGSSSPNKVNPQLLELMHLNSTEDSD